MTDCVIRSRIDETMKTEATILFGKMGLTLSEAIRLFVYQAVAEKRIPFTIGIPNATTVAAMESIEKGEELKSVSLNELEKMWDK